MPFIKGNFGAPRIDKYEEFLRILFGVIDDSPGVGIGPNGPVPIDPGWGRLIERLVVSGGIAARSGGIESKLAAKIRGLAAQDAIEAIRQAMPELEQLAAGKR